MSNLEDGEAGSADGKRVGERYVLRAPLGHGATGTTWRATRVANGDDVAIKEHLVSRRGSFRELDRMRREAALLAQLSHPGIPRLVEHFEIDDGPHTSFYLACELVEGVTLDAELATRRPDWQSVLRDVARLLDILAYLHGLSPAVVHADVKPENILRRAGGDGLVLLDFHAARNFPETREVGTTTAVGTPGFMAPEQLSGRAVPATDVYGAGCVAIALLTGRPLHLLTDESHRLAWEATVVIPPDVKRFLGSMLHPSLARRRADARALAGEARALADGKRPSRRPMLARAAITGVAATAALAVLTTTSLLLQPGVEPEAQPDSERASESEPPSEPFRPAMAVKPVRPSPPPEPSYPTFPAPRILTFPSVPDSKCLTDRSCVDLDRDPLADKILEACRVVSRTKGSSRHIFTAELGKDTASCRMSRHNATCSASCTIPLEAVDAVTYQRRFEVLAQIFRDLHGRDVSTPQWRTDERRPDRIRRSLKWTSPDWRLDLRGDWRTAPLEGERPNELDLDFRVEIGDG